MSKKDRQHQHIQPLTPQFMNQPEQPEKAPDTGGDPSSMGSEARIQRLQSELAVAQKLAAEWEASFKEENGIRLDVSRSFQRLRADIEVITKAARHGAPPEGFEPKTAEGKEALEQVVRLGAENATLTQRMQEDVRKLNEARDISSALRSDLTVLEQTAAGRAPDIALQTDLGKSAAHALSECLTMMDKMNEQHLEGPALPLNGWASGTARQLVGAVPPHDRVLLLGDLLAQLLPHAGEQGQNETASDVLRHIINDLALHKASLTRSHESLQTRARQFDELSERMVKIQSAMVARRAPDAVAGAVLAQLGQLLGSGPGLELRMVEDVKKILAELKSCREFFSEAPLTAVAVRDDGHKGPVRERFSLLVLSWDGKAVSTRAVEEVRPWGDISPYLEQTVRKHLIPGAYR